MIMICSENDRRQTRHHRSTMRLDGAEAVLTLRAVISNGDFDDYWRFHLPANPPAQHKASTHSASDPSLQTSRTQ